MRHDMKSAQEIFDPMPPVAKEAPLTRFLMFKVAVRNDEAELAAECLEKINQSSNDDASILYACVMDAQQVGNKTQSLAALQILIQKFDFGPPEGVHMPALLRCTIRLLISQLEAPDVTKIPSDDVAGQLCKMFEAGKEILILIQQSEEADVSGVTQAQRTIAKLQAGSKVIFTTDELTWFARNSYHLAVKYSGQWAPQNVLRMIDSCTALLHMLPNDNIGEQTSIDISIRLITCDFLSALLLVVLARAQDNVEIQLQNYLTLRKHVKSFNTMFHEHRNSYVEEAMQDLFRKLAVLLAWDFEAGVHLKAWDDLDQIIIKAEACKNTRTYEIMADCLLRSEATALVKITVMKKIINAVWTLECLDTSKLARYMRILFQLALSEGNTAIAEDLLNQTVAYAKAATEVSELVPAENNPITEQADQTYPPEELEWMATTAFNRAVDFYSSEKDEDCKIWADRAINIAHFCTDNGALEALLQDKYLGLNFDAQHD
jgi:hypothetical protein